ncbi:MAG: hypothetical protein DUD30_01180 [Lactobacillus sp.]|nr:MAG: hypothetical protein DUD30_01180 [Lactobacillus sp.]
MSREIKFRAWDNETKDLRQYEEISGICLSALNATDWDLEQFTGLKDQNGKDIYEGDIIKYFGANKRVKIKTTYGIVFYDSEHGCFNSRIQNEEHNKGGISPLDDLIVGNVHTNPELLEAQHD